MFVTSSSQINGYVDISTYYIITESYDYFECNIFDGECDCRPVDDERIRNTIHNSKN